MYVYTVGSISESKLWLDAITQNAWDTGECNISVMPCSFKGKSMPL